MGMCGVCASVFGCARVCGGVRECAGVCVSVRGCVQVWEGVHGYAWVCAGVHRCAWIWDVFSEFLLENRVHTSADFNTFPIRIFMKDPLCKSKFQAISLSQLGVFTNDFLTFLMAHVFLYCPRNFK